MKASVTRMVAAGVVTAATALIGLAGTARADGPCGQDYAESSACGISTGSGSFNGTIVAANDTDYFVFYAQKNTDFTGSITDEETACLSNGGSCGVVDFNLTDSQGSVIGGPQDTSSQGATQTWSDILPNTGSYYIQVYSQQLGTDSSGSPTALPYTLGVQASPAVVWPAPTPAPVPAPAPSKPAPTPVSCIVPSYQGASLSVMRKRLDSDHCAPGPVRRRYDSQVKMGRVIELTAKTGAKLRHDATVGITISEGRKPTTSKSVRCGSGAHGLGPQMTTARGVSCKEADHILTAWHALAVSRSVSRCLPREFSDKTVGCEVQGWLCEANHPKTRDEFIVKCSQGPVDHLRSADAIFGV